MPGASPRSPPGSPATRNGHHERPPGNTARSAAGRAHSWNQTTRASISAGHLPHPRHCRRSGVPAPNCSTVSGCAGSAAARKPAGTCARRLTCSTSSGRCCGRIAPPRSCAPPGKPPARASPQPSASSHPRSSKSPGSSRTGSPTPRSRPGCSSAREPSTTTCAKCSPRSGSPHAPNWLAGYCPTARSTDQQDRRFRRCEQSTARVIVEACNQTRPAPSATGRSQRGS